MPYTSCQWLSVFAPAPSSAVRTTCTEVPLSLTQNVQPISLASGLATTSLPLYVTNVATHSPSTMCHSAYTSLPPLPGLIVTGSPS